MKFLIILILFSTSAIADTYIEKSGNKYPPGYSDTKGNYCVNNSKERDDVIVKSGTDAAVVIAILRGVTANGSVRSKQSAGNPLEL